MIVNQWTKYYRAPDNPIGYDIRVMDGIFNNTSLSGFIPCNAMIIDEDNAYERVMDVLQAFSLMDTDGKKWGLDNGLIRPLGYEADTHAQMILNNFKVVFAWIRSMRYDDTYRPLTAHIIVEIPDSIIKHKHYDTNKTAECNLGKYYVEIEYNRNRGNGTEKRSYPKIHFWQKTVWYDGQDYYFKARHPHISSGEACWGDMQMNSYDPLKSGNILASLTATKVFLRTYNRQSPYDPMDRWQNEWWIFDLPGLVPQSLIVAGNELTPNRISIPNSNAVAIKDDELLARHISNADSNNQDTGAFLCHGFKMLKDGVDSFGMPFHMYHIFQNIGVVNRMNVMPLITRLVLTRGMTWLQALIVSIKILYSEWQSMMSMAPKRWPQGVMKKSEYNVIRIWSMRPHDSQYYQLPGFYRWHWSIDSGRIEKVTDQELRMTDINRHVNSINSIRARNVSFNLQPNSRRNDELPMELLDKVNDREYLDMMDFNSFQNDEFPQSDPSSKRAICKKLRAMINDLDGLYQNAKYLQNKRFLTILNREKEILTNEANNYRPVATEDRLPFKSL